MLNPRLLAAVFGLCVAAIPAFAQSTYTWQPTSSGTWNSTVNWRDQTNTNALPISATNTTLVFNASGTQSYTATNDLGAFTLNLLTVNNTGTGTVTIDGDGPLTLAGTNPTLNINGRALYLGTLAGSNAISKAGTGTFIAGSDNAGFSGNVTINGGTVQVGNGGTAGTLGTGSVTLAGGNLTFNRSDNFTFSNAIAVTSAGRLANDGTGVVNVTSALNLAGSDSLGINFEFGGTGTMRLSGVLTSGPLATLTKTGTGTVIMDGADSGFVNTLNLNAGAFVVRNNVDLNANFINVNSGARFEFEGPAGDPNLPGGTLITINNGGVAQFTEAEDYGHIYLFGGAYNTSVTTNLGNASELRSGTIGSVNGVGGSIGGGGFIQKTTGGTVTVTGVAINNTAGLFIEQGTLSTDAGIGGTTTPTTPTVILSLGNVGAATLEYRGANATVAREVALGTSGGTVRVTESGTTYTFSGVVSGGGNLTKAGAGTLVLSGTNTFTGTTSVSAGTLLVNGNSAAATGAISVANAATLGGTGTLGGATTVASGGTIRGGSGTGTGTLTTRNVTVNSGGRIAVNLAAPGTSSQLAVGSNTLNLITGSRLVLTALPGFTNTNPGAVTYTLATLTNGDNLRLNGASTTDGQLLGTYIQGTGTGTSAVVIDTTALNLTLAAGDTFELNRIGNNLVLTFTPVPEPATVLAIGALGLGAAGWVRRRRQANKAN